MSDLLSYFPLGSTPRPEQRRLLETLADALAEAEDDPAAPRILLVEAPPGVGKSHVAMTLARWSGDAYLLTSQKMLQDQYEREFGAELQVVKGRDNYLCERYPDARVPTSRGMCRRPRGPACQCPYARAKAAAIAGPIFCANTAYFATLRLWHAEHLRQRRVLVVDEAHNLEAQLVGVFTLALTPEEMTAWFGAPLPRLAEAAEYRPILGAQLERLAREREALDRALEALRPPELPVDLFLGLPPSQEEQALLAQRDELGGVLTRLAFFVDAGDREWIVRYPPGPGACLELVPLSVGPLAAELLRDAAEIVVLSSAFLGHPSLLAEALALDADRLRRLTVPSPFPVAQRPIVYRPVGALSKATLPALEPALAGAIATVLREHRHDKGLVHAPSYAAGRRLVRDLEARAPVEARRLLWIDAPDLKARALETHRRSPLPTVLVSPSLREGVDLPDDFLRFQVVTKMPYPDLGEPWTAARRGRDPRWYALETAKALVQAYGRSCRHADDHGVTYVLDAQFARFVQRYRALLPAWFLEAAVPAVRQALAAEAGEELLD